MDHQAFYTFCGKVAREPLVHFVCVGALLFGLNAFMRPVTALPPASSIVITEDDLRQLAGLWQVQWDRTPTPDELRRLAEEQVHEEVLIREALALGLERQDILVRRRLAALAGSEAEAGPPPPPSDAVLRAFYDASLESFAVPTDLTLTQLYFSDRTRNGRSKEEAIQARDALSGRGVSDPAATSLGDPSEFPVRLEAQTPDELAALFGQPFAAAAIRLPVGSWQGPVPSLGGWHLVFIEAATPGPPPAFETVREAVLQAWQQQWRDERQRQAYAAMRARYTVVLPPSLAGGDAP